jgi:hypothetical protein
VDDWYHSDKVYFLTEELIVLIPAKQLLPGYRVYDQVSQRLATVLSVSDQSFCYRIDHWAGYTTAPINDQSVSVVSLGGVG